MRIAVVPPNASQLLAAPLIDIDMLQKKVRAAHCAQRERWQWIAKKQDLKSETAIQYYKNARIPAGVINELCALSDAAEKAFLTGMANFGFSARAGHSILKVARTIADIEGESKIAASAVEEALEYRQLGEGDAVWPF